MASSAPSAFETAMRSSSLRKPAGSSRLSFTLAQIDRKLVVSWPSGLALGPQTGAATSAGVETSSWKICTWFCRVISW
jgi:hypothetical protein